MRIYGIEIRPDQWPELAQVVDDLEMDRPTSFDVVRLAVWLWLKEQHYATD